MHLTKLCGYVILQTGSPMQTYSPSAVANFYLKKAKHECMPLTQMKLHKLIYFAHGWGMGITHKPLLNETVQAWQFGPVVPSVYREFVEYGSRPIDRLATEFSDWIFE